MSNNAQIGESTRSQELPTSVVRAARGAGARWAEQQRELLAREGRLPEGGWPGTLSEARAIAASLSLTRTSPLSAEELTLAAREAYNQAKGAWNLWASELARLERARVTSQKRRKKG